MNSAKSIFLLALLLILVSSLFGQSSSERNSSMNILQKTQVNEYSLGEVVIFQDMRIDQLIYNSVEQNKKKGGIQGYRIRIFSNLGNNARAQSQAAHTRFYELFPEIPIYAVYRSPYFIVYVGDYRTKIDALKDFNKIKRYFPSAFMTPPGEINYPSLDN